MKKLLLLSFIALLWASCKRNEGSDPSIFAGELSKNYVFRLNGFVENRDEILKREGMSLRDFQAWSTDSAWGLPQAARISLRSVRDAITMPKNTTLLQKVIPLEDVANYMNNTYGGTVGGFVSVAADMKRVSNMYDTYWGLRLDYAGTKFREHGAGYGVIRFYSDAVSTLYIPFCAEMGGTYKHSWPNGGGGFTTSKLGEGGYPEYVFNGYSAPQNGAELYEVTPEGREILRSVYRQGKGWQTNEIGMPAPQTKNESVRNGVVEGTRSGEKLFVTTFATWRGNRYIVRAVIGEKYHLTTQTFYQVTGLEVVEKGIWGVVVAEDEIENVWEESRVID